MLNVWNIYAYKFYKASEDPKYINPFQKKVLQIPNSGRISLVTWWQCHCAAVFLLYHTFYTCLEFQSFMTVFVRHVFCQNNKGIMVSSQAANA